MASLDIELERDTEGDQQKWLLDRGFTYPDVPVTARCPYFQSAAGFNVGVFLNRGFMKNTTNGKDSMQALLGISPRGPWCTGHKHNKQKSEKFPPNFNRSTGIMQSAAYTRKQGSLKAYAPFSTLFNVKLLDLLKSVTMQPVTDLRISDNDLIQKLHKKDLCIEHTEKDPLDQALAFQQFDMSKPRLDRFIPVEVYFYKAPQEIAATSPPMDYEFFTLPAFSMTATNFDEDVWLAAEEFQDANPTTYISRVQIIYAIMVFKFVERQKSHVAFPDDNHLVNSEMRLEVFVAYFPTYLRLHEIYRLGAYIDPVYMIRSLYAREVSETGFAVVAPAQDSKWAKVTDNNGLISVAKNPFAFLTPAMMEGSALGGPYLQFRSTTLSEIHHLMGLGSIWTIGLPEPVSANQSQFGLFAFPAHWAPELPRKAETVYVKAETETNGLGFHIDVDLVPESWQTLTSFTSAELCKSQAEKGGVSGKVIVRHTGAKRGVRKLSENPRWTSHLPASDGILCPHHKKHKISNPDINITELAKNAETAKSDRFTKSLGTPENFKVGSMITLQELENDASLAWPDAAAGGINPIKVKPLGAPLSSAQKKVTQTNIPSGSGQSNRGTADEVKKASAHARKLKARISSLEEEISQQAITINDLKEVNQQRLVEIAELSAQLADRREIDGLLHSEGEAMPTDSAIREHKLLEKIRETNTALRLSQHSEAKAREQASQSRTRIMELEAKLQTSEVPEDVSRAQLELLRANATREMAELQKAREELEGVSFTLFELKKAYSTEMELEEMIKRYGEKEKECKKLKDENHKLQRILVYYDEERESDPITVSEPANLLPLALGDMDERQMKRAAEEALFEHDFAPGTKRLKLSTETDIGPYVSSSTGDFYSIAHNMVFREAASGGLINPLHFKVSQHGLVGITELARQRLEQTETVRGVPYDKWKAEKEAELTQRIRGFMSKMGFSEYGHKSMIGLVLQLQNPDPVSSGFLIEKLEAIIQQTDRDRRDLSDILDQVGDEISLRSRHTTGTENAQWLKMAMEEMTLLLTSLFSRYGDERLSTELRIALGLNDYGYTVSEAKKICHKYDELINEYHHLKADSKVPDCYLSALHHLPPE